VGRYAYVVYADNGGTVGGLTVIDVSNPAAPFIVGTIADNVNMLGAATVMVKGKYAYVACSGGNRIEVIDVSNPASPAEVGNSVSITGAGSLYVDNRWAYVLDGTTMKVVDISNPLSGSMPATGSLSIGGASSLWTITKAGRFCYITDIGNASLYTVDVTVPSTPVCIATNHDSVNLNGADDIHIAGDYAYVTQNITNGGVAIFKLSGIVASGISAGNVYADDVNVGNNVSLGKHLYVGDGITAGPNGVLSQGDVSAAGNVLQNGVPFMRPWMGGMLQTASGSTRYLPPFGSSSGAASTEALAMTYIPGPILLTNFFAFMTNIGAGSNFVWTVRTNGASWISITNTSSAAAVSNTTSSVWLTNAQIDIQGVPTGTPNSAFGNFLLQF